MTKNDLTDKYTEFILLNDKPPRNVYSFAKDLGFSESEFYNFFNSFEAINQWVFVRLFEETFALQSKSKDYEGFDDKERLLSFYYTYFELLNSNRSLILELLGQKNPIQNIKVLKLLRVEFLTFIKTIERPKIDLPMEKLESIQNKGFDELMWGQFLMILKYWMEDESPSFTKTDQFIEKSISLGFDLMANTPVDKMLDLGKFLFQDKLKNMFS